MLSQTEGFPNVILEYMNASKPIIATKVGNVPYMLEHGVDSLLVDYGDVASLAEAVYGIASGEIDGPTLGRNAKSKLVANYEIEAIAKQYEYVIEKTLDDRR
jgi:glycosyltransferase involved in cell wall biosynthesis